MFIVTSLVGIVVHCTTNQCLNKTFKLRGTFKGGIKKFVAPISQ